MQFGIQPKTGGTYHGLSIIRYYNNQAMYWRASFSSDNKEIFLHSHDTPKLQPTLLFPPENNKSKITLLMNESYKHLIINHKITSNTALLIVSLFSTERF